MKFVAGYCIFCGRLNGTQTHSDGNPICAESNDTDSSCYHIWEKRVMDMFDQLANDHRK